MIELTSRCRAVVFDIGGVLEYTPDLGVLRRVAGQLGLTEAAVNERLADVFAAGGVGTMTEAEVRDGIVHRLGIPHGRVDELLRDIWREYLGTPNVEMIDYLRGLRSRCRTGLLSNSFVGAREREQAAYGLAELTDVLVYSHEVGMSKPDQRIYELTCERLGVDPGGALFLDDAEENVRAAADVGMIGIRFRDNAQAITAVERWLACCE